MLSRQQSPCAKSLAPCIELWDGARPTGLRSQKLKHWNRSSDEAQKKKTAGTSTLYRPEAQPAEQSLVPRLVAVGRQLAPQAEVEQHRYTYSSRLCPGLALQWQWEAMAGHERDIDPAVWFIEPLPILLLRLL